MVETFESGYLKLSLKKFGERNSARWQTYSGCFLILDSWKIRILLKKWQLSSVYPVLNIPGIVAKLFLILWIDTWRVIKSKYNLNDLIGFCASFYFITSEEKSNLIIHNQPPYSQKLFKSYNLLKFRTYDLAS